MAGEADCHFWRSVAFIDHARLHQTLHAHHFHASDSIRAHWRKKNSHRLRRRPVKQRVNEERGKRYTFVASAGSDGAEVFALDATPAKTQKTLPSGKKKWVVPNFTAKHLIHVFDKILKRTEKRVWVLDNEPCHKRDLVLEWAQAQSPPVRLLFLPPRSPDLMIHDDCVISAARRALAERIRILGRDRERWSEETWRRCVKLSVESTAPGATKWIEHMTQRLERLLEDPQIGGGAREGTFEHLEDRTGVDQTETPELLE
jgi:hypothetical protein